MSDQIDTMDWAAISAALRAPFDPADVEFRVQGNAGPSGKAQIVAYVDARAVQDRLDDVVGAGAWSFDWMPLITDKGDVQVAKGTLTIHGIAKSDAGTASNFESSLGAVSHCLKRAAVMWGIGRYLYNLPATWETLDDKKRIPAQTLAALRAKLPRPDGTPAPAQATAQSRQSAATRTATPTPTPAAQRTPAPAQRDAGRPTAARATAASVSAPATDVSEWVTTDGYDPTGDLDLKKRAHRIGVNNMADYEAILGYAREHYRTYDRTAVDAAMRVYEGRYETATTTVAKTATVTATTAQKGA